MRDNDSYPPADTVNNTEKSFEEETAPQKEESSQSTHEDSEDVPKQEEWDGSEAEIVVDDETEEYEDENTGIKIKYTLKPEEIKRFICHSEGFEKNKKAQKKHTVIQAAVLAAVILLSAFAHSISYLWVAALPLAAILTIWLVPYFGIKKIIRNIFKDEETTVEIFPDKIDVTTGSSEREILLDGSCESEEFEDMILIFSQNGINLMIPLRAVEPEFRAEVQAMILAGAKPRYKN